MLNFFSENENENFSVSKRRKKACKWIMLLELSGRKKEERVRK